MNRWLDELRGNPRLRAGLLFIAALVWLLGLLELGDLLDAARAERSRLVTEVERLRAAGRDSGWPAAREEALAALAAYRGRAWREESEGRMQALMQDWLREKMAGAGLQPLELSVAMLAPAPATDGTPTDLPPEARLLRARLVFEFRSTTLHEFLASVGNSPNWIWVSHLVVRNGERRQVELELEALFINGSRGAS